MPTKSVPAAAKKKRTVHVIQEPEPRPEPFDWCIRVEGAGRRLVKGEGYEACVARAQRLAAKTGAKIVVHHKFGQVEFMPDSKDLLPRKPAPDSGFRRVPHRQDSSVVVDPESGVEVSYYGNDKGPYEARQHGKQRPVLITEAGGKTVTVRKTEDMLYRLFRNGDISAGAHNAGRKFQRIFERASVNPTARSSMELVDGGGQGGGMTDATVEARQALYAVLDDVGGAGSPNGRVLWECLGNGSSFNQFAQIQIAGQPSINRQEAKGILRSALAQLAKRWDKTNDRKVEI